MAKRHRELVEMHMSNEMKVEYLLELRIRYGRQRGQHCLGDPDNFFRLNPISGPTAAVD